MENQEATEKLLAALRHPVRREMLVKVVALGTEVSPRGLAEEVSLPLSNASYHVRVLVDCGALRLVDLRQVRGSLKHFYEPTELLEHPVARATLGLDNEGDTDQGS